MKRIFKSRKGFTLIEMVLVIDHYPYITATLIPLITPLAMLSVIDALIF